MLDGYKERVVNNDVDAVCFGSDLVTVDDFCEKIKIGWPHLSAVQ